MQLRGALGVEQMLEVEEQEQQAVELAQEVVAQVREVA
jgi:hypothetical protein